MKVGIMQAYFFPFIGYFQLIDASDDFILYEHVTFRKKSWITKNRILDKGRKLAIDIKIPVNKKSSHKKISEIELNNTDWKKPLLKQIYFNYKKSIYFDEIYPLIEKCINTKTSSLHKYNSSIIKEICNYLDFTTKIKSANEEFLDMEENFITKTVLKDEIKSLRIIEICKNVKANTYINPIGGTELYDKSYFKKNDIDLFFVNTKEYLYSQFDLSFTPHLSIIDVLMHNGKEGTKKIVKNYSLRIMMTLEESVQEFINEKKSYYQQWVFEEPIIISAVHNNDFCKLQKIMYKLIQEFVINYQEYKHLMPVNKGVEVVLNVFNKKEYKIGTYRTDFVYDTDNQEKIIEITCRFALNGIFLAGLMDDIAKSTKPISLSNVKIKDQYSAIYKHLKNYLKDATSICVLKGGDVRNESKLYIDILKRTNLEVKEILYTEIDKNFAELENSWVISELSFDEILSLSQEVLEKLALSNIINDFRTVFLIHDKRFFSVLGKKELQNKVLSKEEILLFDKFYIPTYSANEAEEIWDIARKNKNEWIIKHRALGKSQKIYAGLVTPSDEWNAVFESSDFKDMTLQEWIPQKTIKGEINGEKFNDFVTGTALFFDDNYFGFGDFRTSSHPVTNKVDHRKAAGLILNEEKKKIDQVINHII